MNRQSLLKQVKETVHEIEPDATIIMYGSRSRGDADEDSDWDFLILIKSPTEYQITEKIRNHLYDIELQSNEILSSIIRNDEEWHSPKFMCTPFYKNVSKEGIVL
jgi:predicted nucleotidyltransferase